MQIKWLRKHLYSSGLEMWFIKANLKNKKTTLHCWQIYFTHTYTLLPTQTHIHKHTQTFIRSKENEKVCVF